MDEQGSFIGPTGFRLTLPAALRRLDERERQQFQSYLKPFETILDSPKAGQFKKVYETLHDSLTPVVMREAYSLARAWVRREARTDKPAEFSERLLRMSRLRFEKGLADQEPLRKVTEVAGAMAEDKTATVDLFLSETLRLRRELKRGRAVVWEALWKHLRSFYWWPKVQPGKHWRWLREAVRRDAKRLENNKERGDRVWWQQAESACQEPALFGSDPPLNLNAKYVKARKRHEDAIETRVPSFEEVTIRKDLARHVVLGIVPPDLPEQHRKMALMILADAEPMEAAKAVRGGKSTWVSFQNKMLRRVQRLDDEGLSEALGAVGNPTSDLLSIRDWLRRRGSG